MNNGKRQELGNELQSSQHLRLQSASCKLLDVATVPVAEFKVQRKKSIGGIWNVAPHATVELRSTGQLRTAVPTLALARRKKGRPQAAFS